jgi:nitrous oxidase accessory protein NosD
MPAWVQARAGISAFTPFDAGLRLARRIRMDVRTDDTASLQAALDSLSPGRELAIPAGTYLVDQLTISTDGVRIRGTAPGTVLRHRGGGQALLLIEASGCTVEDLRLQDRLNPIFVLAQNASAWLTDEAAVGAVPRDGFTARRLRIECTQGGSSGIVVFGTHRALIEECHVTQAGTAIKPIHDGIRIQSAKDTAANPVEGCIVRRNVVNGSFFRSIQSRGSGVRQDLRIEANQVSGSVGCGIWAYRTAGLQVTDNAVSNSQQDGIFFDPVTGRRGSGTCSDNQVDSCGRFGIMTEEAKNGSVISGNSIRNCGTGMLVGGGCESLTITGNSITESAEHGILLDRFGGTPNERPSAEITLTGNVLSSSGIAGILARGIRRSLRIEQNTIDNSGARGAEGAGIVLEPAAGGHPNDGVHVVGNIVSHTAAPQAGIRARAIAVTPGGADGLTITGNRFPGHDERDLDVGGGVAVTVSDNSFDTS